MYHRYRRYTILNDAFTCYAMSSKWKSEKGVLVQSYFAFRLMILSLDLDQLLIYTNSDVFKIFIAAIIGTNTSRYTTTIPIIEIMALVAYQISLSVHNCLICLQVVF